MNEPIKMESNDPVSEFLAREQNVLGDLGEDLIVQPELGGSSAENNGIRTWAINFWISRLTN